MKTLSEIQAERAAAQLKYQQEKALREVTGVAGKVSMLQVTADTGFAIRLIHEIEKSADFLFHNYNGDARCSEICHAHYDGEVCPICNSISTKYGKRFATATKFFLAHVYNLVGKEFLVNNRNTGLPEIDSTTGLQRIGKWNPLKLIGIPLGKKDAYIKPFLASAKRGTLQSDIFLIKRVSNDGWQVPEVITETELKELLGPSVPLALPTEYSKYAEMDKRTLWKLILTAMPGARVDELLGPDPSQKQLAQAVQSTGVVVNPFAVPTSVQNLVTKPMSTNTGIDSAFE